MFTYNIIYDTAAEIQDLHGAEIAVLSKIAGNIGSQYVKMHPVTPSKFLTRPYLGIGFTVTKRTNFLLLKSDYPFIRFLSKDLLIIHFDNQAMEISFTEAENHSEYSTTMVTISDNQLLHLNDTLVTHATYHTQGHVINIQFANSYNCQYETPYEGAELLKTAAMRICGAKLVMLHRKRDDGLTQYELIK